MISYGRKMHKQLGQSSQRRTVFIIVESALPYTLDSPMTAIVFWPAKKCDKGKAAFRRYVATKKYIVMHTAS
ncbi:hypothetical protein BDN67DRAFT_655889 [Paxillus ammoniavirescens]|nr:hypothetical protein BDN67DRAFT_655889 [Paxillus ammoniavirescens]